MAKRKWKDLSPKTRKLLVAAGIAQVVLLSIAHGDLTRRSQDEVRGPKRAWRLITLIDFVGPIAYFIAGRRPRTTVAQH